MKKLFLYALVVLILPGCQKVIDALAGSISYDNVKYTIAKGQQYCDPNTLKSVQTSEMKFVVKFDSSAIYTTVLPENQYDINKLFGFSDNSAEHQEYSARFGWRWSDGALRLFAYTYNNSVRTSQELGIVPIGPEINCSIKVDGSSYIFSLEGKLTTMPRLSTTAQAHGYQLYPYFGGNEVAPHNITIWIRQVK